MAAKAQAAMEFLMTYGWAILAVIIVIGALTYFGVLNPSNLVPERCVLTAPLDCRAASATATGGADNVKLNVRNIGSRDLTARSITVTSGTDVLSGSCTWSGTTALAAGANADLTAAGVPCVFVKAAGAKVKLNSVLTYTYDDAATITNSMTGELVSSLQ